MSRDKKSRLNPKVFPKSEEQINKETISKLKTRIKQLTKENKILKSENNQYEAVFQENMEKIRQLTDMEQLENLLKE